MFNNYRFDFMYFFFLRGGGGGGVLFSFFSQSKLWPFIMINISYIKWLAPYTLESFLTTVDHFNLHFPTIYIVRQQHILRDLFRGYNSFWFILCEQIFWDTIFRGEWRIGKWVETLESGCKLHEVTGKIFKTEKQKKKVFRLQTPLITSWFREKYLAECYKFGFF